MYILLAILACVLVLWFLRVNSWLPALFRWAKTRLPRISKAEEKAMLSGDAWWEAAIFRGRLDWERLQAFAPTTLSEDEKRFLSCEMAQFCALLDCDEIDSTGQLPESAWSFIRDHRLWGLTIPNAHGGLGFSECALAAIVARIASRNVAAAITVMVPNTVGPASFIMLHGTEEQKQSLSRYASGEFVGCFALTSVVAGSDAGHLQDNGVVSLGQGDQAQTLGLRLNWSKRYISLAPRANQICLACRVQDPDNLLPAGTPLGISLVLVPVATAGVTTGHAHRPMTAGLANGTTQGRDVWLPLSCVVGGEEGIGHGWVMLMDELAAGRGISLPSLAVALTQMSFRMTHIYGRVRRQFSRPLLAFSGISGQYLKLAGFSLIARSVQWFTVQGLGAGVRPAIAAAVAKYHLTEMARQSVNIAMDIHGGRAAQLGSRNYFFQMYRALPVMVTVEGANILTRHLIIFGQGLVRCHPYLSEEWSSLKGDGCDKSLRRFDRVVWKHVLSFLGRSCQVVWSRLTGGGHFYVPKNLPGRRYLQNWLRLSQAFAWMTDAYLLALGGGLKEDEQSSARLGDVLSYLYMMLSVWVYQRHHPEQEGVVKMAEWAYDYCTKHAQIALMELVRSFPVRRLRWLLRQIVFPAYLVYDKNNDKVSRKLTEKLLTQPNWIDQLTPDCFRSSDPEDATGRMEALNDIFNELSPILKVMTGDGLGDEKPAIKPNNDWRVMVEAALAAGIGGDQAEQLRSFADRCWDALQVD